MRPDDLSGFGPVGTNSKPIDHWEVMSRETDAAKRLRKEISTLMSRVYELDARAKRHEDAANDAFTVLFDRK